MPTGRFKIKINASLEVIHPDGEVQRPRIRIIHDRGNDAFGIQFIESPEERLRGLIFFIDAADLLDAKENGFETDRLLLEGG